MGNSGAAGDEGSTLAVGSLSAPDVGGVDATGMVASSAGCWPLFCCSSGWVTKTPLVVGGSA